MFSFLKSKPKAAASDHGARQHPAPDDDAWHVGAIGSAGVERDGGYDDVSLGDASGGANPRAGEASDPRARAQSSGRASFSAPSATPGAFVGGSGSSAVSASAYDSATSASTSDLNLASGHATASYPPARATGSRVGQTNGYPSLRSTFTRLEAFLADASPTLLDSLAAPLLPTAPALSTLLHAISPYYLPTSVLEAYSLHDGQDPFSSCQQGLVWGLHWLPIDEVEQEWQFWRRFEQAGGEGGMHDAFSARTAEAHKGSGRIHPYVSEGDEDDGAGVAMPGMRAFPPGWVRSRYSHPGWLPLLTDRVGNYIGVDLDPPPPEPNASARDPNATYGQAGQVIAFGREIDEKVVLFPGDSAGGWGRFLAAFTDDLERGEFASLKEAADSSRKSGSSWAGQSGNGSSDDDDSWGDGDGLGDVDYLDGDRYGDEGERGAQLWALRSEYRRWAAGGGEGGLVGAIAERSRRQWRAVGVGLEPATSPTTPFASAGKNPPLSIVVPAHGSEVDAGPESAATERPTSPNLMSTDSARTSLEKLPTSSTSSSLMNGHDSFSSEHPLNGHVHSTDNSVELTLSPPSPKPARFESLPDVESRPPRSPEFLDDGRRRAAEQRRAGGSGSKTRRRPPPPAPMPFDLPTMQDLDLPLPGSTHHDDGGVGLGYAATGRRSADSFGSATPTRQSFLPTTSRSASTTALVPGDEGLGLSHLNLGASGEMEVVVDQNRARADDRNAGRSPPPPSDQPYLTSPRVSEDRGSAGRRSVELASASPVMSV